MTRGSSLGTADDRGHHVHIHHQGHHHHFHIQEEGDVQTGLETQLHAQSEDDPER